MASRTLLRMVRAVRVGLMGHSPLRVPIHTLGAATREPLTVLWARAPYRGPLSVIVGMTSTWKPLCRGCLTVLWARAPYQEPPTILVGMASSWACLNFYEDYLPVLIFNDDVIKILPSHSEGTMADVFLKAQKCETVKQCSGVGAQVGPWRTWSCFNCYFKQVNKCAS